MPARPKTQKNRTTTTFKNTSVSLPDEVWEEINDRVENSNGKYSSVSHFIRVVIQDHCAQVPFDRTKS